MSIRPSRRISTTLFAATILAFLLPFATVSCDADEVSFTGAELATYRVANGGELDEEVESQAGWAAFLVLAAAITGVGLAASGRAGAGTCAAIGLFGMELLLWIAASSLATVTLRVGFWLALALAAATAARELVLRLREWRRDSRHPWPIVAGAIVVLLPGPFLVALVAAALG